MRSILWMSEPLSRALRDQLPSDTIVAGSKKEFLDAPRDAATISFVDGTTIAEVDKQIPQEPVIAICDDSIQTAVKWLAPYSWLSHVVSSSMLSSPMFERHLRNVTSTLVKGGQPKLLSWLGSSATGRRIRLTQSKSRVDRLERVSEFFASKGVSSRTTELVRDVAEELLTNAFYDAPVAAGATKPISRTVDVTLPDDNACDMVYAFRDDVAVVRVRDPFGSLTRLRLVEVLSRCARTDMQVEIDETMGGAGLGLWRIFSVASFVAVSVVNNRSTEFLVGIGKRGSAAPNPFAFHLFFKEPGRPVRRWKLLDEDESKPSLNHSVTILNK